jgi:hypothetical protein
LGPSCNDGIKSFSSSGTHRLAIAAKL